MKVSTVINQDVLIALDDNYNEVIIFGPEIGKESQIKNQVDENKIERILKTIDPIEYKHLVDLLKEADCEDLRMSIFLIEECEKLLENKIDTRLFITLTDHILFALKRLKEDIPFKNQLLKEIRMFYPDELLIAKKALAALNDEYGIEMPEDEAGYIALHLVNSASDSKLPIAETAARIINNSLRMIKLTYNINLKEENLNSSRFIKHFKNIIDRALSGKMSKEEDPVFFETIKKSYPKSYSTAKRIRNYIYNRYSILLTEEELINLTIHLNRLIETNRK